MGLIAIVLLVILVISAVLLVLVVLVQDDQGEGIGGIFGGGSNTAFGSRSGNVLTRFTAILAAVFLVCFFGLAWVNRTPEAGNVIGKAAPAGPERRPAAELVGADPAAGGTDAARRSCAGQRRRLPGTRAGGPTPAPRPAPASPGHTRQPGGQVGWASCSRSSSSPARIKCHLEAEDKAEVFEELVDLLVTQYGPDSRDEILEAIRRREEKMSTGIKKGIAIPHAKTQLHQGRDRRPGDLGSRDRLRVPGRRARAHAVPPRELRGGRGDASCRAEKDRASRGEPRFLPGSARGGGPEKVNRIIRKYEEMLDS